jgi:hypothetical protein
MIGMAAIIVGGKIVGWARSTDAAADIAARITARQERGKA